MSNPPTKVNGHSQPITSTNCKQKQQMDEIQARLRKKETQKAMALLAKAMSQHEAFEVMKQAITKQVCKNDSTKS